VPMPLHSGERGFVLRMSTTKPARTKSTNRSKDQWINVMFAMPVLERLKLTSAKPRLSASDFGL